MDSKVLLSILVCLFVVQLNAQRVTISGVSPRETVVAGRSVVGVTGCGFKQFNEAVCTWNFQYYSPIHVILSDTLIYCETPHLNITDFDALPQYANLYVVFDGDSDNTVLVTKEFLFGPSLVAFSPTNGYVGGGEQFKVIGRGFSDFSYVNVTFDSVQCLNTVIVNDYEITCTVPPGNFSQDAIISLTFENNTDYFLRFDSTYHYGAIISSVYPPCGDINGGTSVTIVGVNFDDPFLAINTPPLRVTPQVEVIFNLTRVTRVYATNVQFDPLNNLIVFNTPYIGPVFGARVEFAVYFKTLFSVVSVTLPAQFIYGPVLYSPFNTYYGYLPGLQNPSQSIGHVGGGDSLSFYGCGLSQFSASQFQVFYNNISICEPDSIVLFKSKDLTEDYLNCTTVPLSCNDVNTFGEIYFTVETGIHGLPTARVPPLNEFGLFYEIGPIVEVYSMYPTRGPRTGGQNVTIQGLDLFYSGTSSASNPGWTLTVHFTDPTNSGVVIPSVTGSIDSDTQLSFITPVGLFDLDVLVSFEFGTCATEFPIFEFSPYYHFGPVCSYITPTNGYFGGGSEVTIIGEGFEEDNNLVTNTYVEMCLNRLETSAGCPYEPTPRNSFFLNDTQITFVTPSSRQNVLTLVGNNRLFGDYATVSVHFYQPGTNGVEFPFNQLRPGLTEATITCPYTYQFSPIVESVTPNNGAVVPRVNPVPAPVVINGEYFNDPALVNNITVAFSGLLTLSPTIASDSAIDADLTWGLKANIDANVAVVFDIGNATATGVTIGFGPAIYALATEKLGYPIVSTFNPNADVYGLFPNGNETIIVTGEGFAEYNGSIKCIIGGESVDYYLDSDTQIRCITPCRPFGSQATLQLSFGTVCGSNAINWRNTLTADQVLFYKPRIDSFSPAFGKTSGGDTVTVVGEGFKGWGKYECFFGYYSNSQQVLPSSDGTTIVCSTPINRAEFNSYVTVQIQLSALNDDVDVEAGYVTSDQSCSNPGVYVDETIYPTDEVHDFKVYAANKFYYGPVCSDISPSSCPLTGCVAAVVGSGFQDCKTGNQSLFTRDYPYNDCTFRFYKVRYVDPSTGDIVYVSAPTNDTLSPGNSVSKLYYYAPARPCGYQPQIQIEFFSPVVTTAPSSDDVQSKGVITCTPPSTRAFTFHYGPLITAQSSTYYDATRSLSYGWSGDTVTLSGIDFRDTDLFGQVNCNFGNISTVATSVDTIGATVVCTVPQVANAYWNTIVNVSLSWSGGLSTCAVAAQQFHFGPTIRSISPSRGFVAGGTPVTISGFAFECCGITKYSCQFPAVTPPWVDNTALASANSVTCSVPLNQDIDVLINNVGVAFTSTKFGTQDLTFTEQGTSLTYYYGPYVTSFTPSHSTLSGRDQYVTIVGEGFDDPYLLDTFCDFFNATTPGFDYVPQAPLEEEYVTATTITCPVPLFAHYAGAVDSIRPRWRRSVQQLRPELKKYYYKTVPPTLSNVNHAPFFSDGGSLTPAYLTGFAYGPVVTSVCVGNLCGSDLPRSAVAGGLQINVTFDSLRDFVSNSSTRDFGYQNALCIFGNRASNSLTPIVASADADTPGTVLCTSPAGDFDFDGELVVILNPLISSSTTNSALYHTRPYTSGISSALASSDGAETVVIYGSDFCNYDSVTCSFSNGVTPLAASQGDITSDQMITCKTPAHGAGYSSVSLQFCSQFDFEFCDCNNAEDLVTVPNPITFYGINSIAPTFGSPCGGTIITFSGYGFESFDSITCTYPNSLSQLATVYTDNLFTCNSIDISSVFNDDVVQCSQITVTATRGARTFTLDVPNSLEAGFPQITSISPSSLSLTGLTPIIVQGLYFNGNGLSVNCLIANVTTVAGVLEVDSYGNYYVVCVPPSTITVGTYDLQLEFGCSSDNVFITNTFHFNVTQSPVIQTVRPLIGPEIGGQTVTITGYNFNGGSVYVCVFGDIVVGATYSSSTSEITCKTPAILDTYEDIRIGLYISLDGGRTLTRSQNDYIYQNIAIIREGSVCLNEQALIAGNGAVGLSASLFLSLLFICISLAF